MNPPLNPAALGIMWGLTVTMAGAIAIGNVWGILAVMLLAAVYIVIAAC